MGFLPLPSKEDLSSAASSLLHLFKTTEETPKEQKRWYSGRQYTPDSLAELGDWLKGREYEFTFPSGEFDEQGEPIQASLRPTRRNILRVMKQFPTATSFAELLHGSLNRHPEDQSLISKKVLIALYQTAQNQRRRKPVSLVGEQVADEQGTKTWKFTVAPISGKIINPITKRQESPWELESIATKLFPEIQFVHGPFEKKVLREGGVSFAEPYSVPYLEIARSLRRAEYVMLTPNSDHDTIPIVPLKFHGTTYEQLNAERTSLAQAAVQRNPEYTNPTSWPVEFVPDEQGHPVWKGYQGYGDDPRAQHGQFPDYEMTRLYYLSQLFGPEIVLFKKREMAKRSGQPFIPGRQLAPEVTARIPLKLQVVEDYKTEKGEPIEDGLIWVTPEVMNLYEEGGGLDDRTAKPQMIYQDTETGQYLMLKGMVQQASGSRLAEMRKKDINHLAMVSSAKRMTGLEKETTYELPWKNMRIIADQGGKDRKGTTSRQMWAQVDDPAVWKVLIRDFIQPRLEKVNEKFAQLRAYPEMLDAEIGENVRVGVAPHPASLGLVDDMLYRGLLNNEIFKMEVPGTNASLRAMDPRDQDNPVMRQLTDTQIIIPWHIRDYLGIPKKLTDPNKIRDWLQKNERYVIVYRSPISKPDGVLRLRVMDIFPDELGNVTTVSARNVIDRVEGDQDGDHLHILMESTFEQGRERRVFPQEYSSYLQKILEGKLPNVGPVQDKINLLRDEKAAEEEHTSMARAQVGYEIWQDFMYGKKSRGEIVNLVNLLHSMRVNELVIDQTGIRKKTGEESKPLSMPIERENVTQDLHPELMIISGGQTGADRGALEGAKKSGLRTGGAAPKGWLTEIGEDRSLAEFGLIESQSYDYAARTQENVQQSQGTVIFGNIQSTGSKLTLSLAKKLKKPYLVNPNSEQLKAFMIGKKVINIAGNRESVTPGIQETVSQMIQDAVQAHPVQTENYEVSSAGDKRFSALYAKLNDGRTIEEAYQLDIKGYRTLGNDWRLGKGKPPLREMSQDQLWQEYLVLWQQWARENPELIEDLRNKVKGKRLSDQYAKTPINQARALTEILGKTERQGQVFDPSTLSLEQMRDIRQTLAYWLQLSVDNSKYGLLKHVWKSRAKNFSEVIRLASPIAEDAIPSKTYNWANNLYPREKRTVRRKGISSFFKTLQEYHQREDIPIQAPVEQTMWGLSDTPFLPERDTKAYESLKTAHTSTVRALTDKLPILSDNDLHVISSFQRFTSFYRKNVRKAWNELPIQYRKLLIEKGYHDTLTEEEYLDEGWAIREQASNPVRFDQAILRLYRDNPELLEFQFLTGDGMRQFRSRYLSTLAEQGIDWGQPGIILSMMALPFDIESIRKLKQTIAKAKSTLVDVKWNRWMERREDQFLESRLDWLRGINTEGNIHLAPSEMRRLEALHGRTLQERPLDQVERRELLELIGLLEKSIKTKDFTVWGRALGTAKGIGEMGWPIRTMIEKISSDDNRIAGLTTVFRKAMDPIRQLGMDKKKADTFTKLVMGDIQEKDLPSGMEELPHLFDTLYKPRSNKKLVDKTDKDLADYPDEANTDSVMNELYSMLYAVWMKHSRPALKKQLTLNDNAFRYAYEVYTGGQSGVGEYLSHRTRRKSIIEQWLDPSRILPYEKNYFPLFIKTDKRSPDVMIDKISRAESAMERFRGDPHDPNALNPLTLPTLLSRMLARRPLEFWMRKSDFETNAGQVLPEYAETVLFWAMREEAKHAYRVALQNITTIENVNPEQGKKLLSLSAWMESYMKEVLGYNEIRYTPGGQATRLIKNGALAALTPASNLKNRLGGRDLVFVSNGLQDAFGWKHLKFHKDQTLELDPLTGMTLAKLRELGGIQVITEGATREGGIPETQRSELSRILREQQLEKAKGSKVLEKFVEHSRWLADLNFRLGGKYSYSSGEEFWRTQSLLSGYMKEVAFQKKSGRRPGEGRQDYIERVRKFAIRSARTNVNFVMGDYRPEMLPELMRSNNWYNLLFTLRRWNYIYAKNVKKIFLDDPHAYGWDRENLLRASRYIMSVGIKDLLEWGSAATLGFSILSLSGDDVASAIWGLGKMLRGDTEDLDPELLPGSLMGGRVFGPIINLIVAVGMENERRTEQQVESLGRLAGGAVVPFAPAFWPTIKQGYMWVKGERDIYSAIGRSLGLYRLRKTQPRMYSPEWFAQRRRYSPRRKANKSSKE